MTSAFQNLPPAPRLLIFRGGAIGDFILTLPVFQVLRETWPQADLTVVGFPHIAELARVSGLIDRVLSADAARFSAYYTPERPLPPQEAEFLRSFDLVLSFLHDPDGALRSNWERAGARRVSGVSPRVTTGHAADYFMRALAPLGLTYPELSTIQPADPRQTAPVAQASGLARLPHPARRANKRFPDVTALLQHGKNAFICGKEPWLKLPSHLQSEGRAKLESLGLRAGVIAIHPGSGSKKKNWPLSSFLAVAEKIIETGTLGRPLWIVGEADAAIAPALETGEAGSAPVLKDCSLADVASVLTQCRGYLGNDSGITHLAAALGVPTIALFGPTDPAVWGPRGRRVAILRAQPPTPKGLARMPVDDVWRIVRGWL